MPSPGSLPAILASVTGKYSLFHTLPPFPQNLPRTLAFVLHPLVHRTSKDIPPSLPATAFVSLSAYGE